MPGDSYAIKVEGLTKFYGDFLAVDRINFQVGRGEFFGFLGPNGAGKTTTVRMLTGLLPISSGEAWVMGFNIENSAARAKEAMGIVPETANTYLDLTAWENLFFMGRMYGMERESIRERAAELLTAFDLYDSRNIKTIKFSRGMRQRVVLCSALLHDPELLFLDEPTSGLDVQSTRLIRRMLVNLNNEGRTIFLMTHNIEEANRLCGRVAIINEGRIAAIDSPENLRQDFRAAQSIELILTEEEELNRLRERISSLSEVNRVEVTGEKIRIYTQETHRVISSIVDMAEEAGAAIKALNTLAPSLEDVFVRLTERGPVGDETDRSNNRGEETCQAQH